jgi:hypothetical protein
MIQPLNRNTLFPLLFSQHMPPNSATARDTLTSKGLNSPEIFSEHWIPIRGKRHTWISEENGHIDGLVSVKASVPPIAWQVDYLQVARESVCIDLLDTASAAAVERGVRKLFLRLNHASPLISEARRAGFISYTTEYLYNYKGEIGQIDGTIPQPYTIRPRHRADENGLFELYKSAVPQQVRLAEGITPEEWRASMPQGPLLQQHKEFVLLKGTTLVGWLRIDSAGGAGHFDLIYNQFDDDSLMSTVNHALTRLARKQIKLCTVHSYQTRLKTLVESSGFEQMAEYNSLVKEIAIKVREPSFMPMRA